MSTAPAATLSEVEVFRSTMKITDQIVRRNLEGISQNESLVQPIPAGNCINWIFGHMVWVCDEVLPLLKQQSVVGVEALQRYARGAAPLEKPTEAIDLRELTRIWDQAMLRMDAGFASLTAEDLDAVSPISPNNNSSETIRSFFGLVAFHQAYHAGQLGVLRRIVGKPGAIA